MIDRVILLKLVAIAVIIVLNVAISVVLLDLIVGTWRQLQLKTVSPQSESDRCPTCGAPIL